MSKNLVTCDLNTSVTELMDEMTEKKIRHILIMEDKKLLGIVSIGDVVNHLIAKIKAVSYTHLTLPTNREV